MVTSSFERNLLSVSFLLIGSEYVLVSVSKNSLLQLRSRLIVN
jgi:hypothetical protein